MARRPCPRRFVLAAGVLLSLGGCASGPAPVSPLRFERASDPATGMSLSIRDLGPCRSDRARGITIDPARPLVVLVHGWHSSPARFATLARVFEAQGQQTVCFAYNDRESLEDSAGRLVAALEALKPHLQSRHITVLGHSTGGLIARRAFVRDRTGALRDGEGFRYELVTVASPFHGIESSADCGSTLLHIMSLGVTAGVCRMVAGAMWSEIYPRSSFMRRPGALLASVDRYVKVVTDERATCRRRGATGRCLKRDFVFTLPEQYGPLGDDDARAQTSEIKAGHMEIVGELGNPPDKLIQLLEEKQLLAAPERARPPAPARHGTLAAVVRQLY